MNIPEEAVEAAANIIRERDYPDYTPDLDFARRVLRVAAPFIAAQALREASDAYPLETAYGGAEHAVLWLKERAENMNGSGT